MAVVIKSSKVKILTATILLAEGGLIVSIFLNSGNSTKVKFVPSMRPPGMVSLQAGKDDFVDTPGRVNKASNVEDFGAQGNN